MIPVRSLPLTRLAILCSVLVAAPAAAHDRYSGGCDQCHDPFNAAPYVSLIDGHEWPASLHDVHESSVFMGSDCDTCHSDARQSEPVSFTKSLSGPGCLGCHGRPDGDRTSGDGLLILHFRAGEGDACIECHDRPELTPPENVLPEFYASPLSLIDDPCDAGEEDFSGDGRGLDNDGDGLYDAEDDDCREAPPMFIRGDSDGSGVINITDGVFTLEFLFSGTKTPPCHDAADVNDDEQIQITDPVFTFLFLFAGGSAPLPPYPDPGSDPEGDELPCEVGLEDR